MTAKEFLDSVPEFRPGEKIDPEEIEDLAELWASLIDRLDCHGRKWYELKDDKWQLIAFPLVHDLLYLLGVGEEKVFEKVFDRIDGELVERSVLVPDPEREQIIRQFIHRDEKASPRDKDAIAAAQLRLGI